MTDTGHHDDDTGDAPDTFDDRLVAVGRLIATFADERDETRRQHRRTVIVHLLAVAAADALAGVGVLLDQVADL